MQLDTMLTRIDDEEAAMFPALYELLDTGQAKNAKAAKAGAEKVFVGGLNFVRGLRGKIVEMRALEAAMDWNARDSWLDWQARADQLPRDIDAAQRPVREAREAEWKARPPVPLFHRDEHGDEVVESYFATPLGTAGDKAELGRELRRVEYKFDDVRKKLEAEKPGLLKAFKSFLADQARAELVRRAIGSQLPSEFIDLIRPKPRTVRGMSLVSLKA